MPVSRMSLVQEHGTALDKQGRKVRCNYCAEVVSGFYHLKCHLGNTGEDLSPCQQVPDSLKAQIRNDILEAKKQMLGKQVEQLYHPDLRWKRNCVPKSAEPTSVGGNVDGPKLTPVASEAKEEVMGYKSKKKAVTQNKSVPCMTTALGDSTVKYFSKCKSEKEDDQFRIACRSIGRFFYDSGIHLTAAESPCFQIMIDAAIACGSGFKAPCSSEIAGWILGEELEDIYRHCIEIKSSWENTGCSILLNGWTNERDRTILIFLVDSPRGTMFLNSVDASDWVSDVDNLFLLFDRVVEVIGVANVVQVVMYDNASTYIEAAGKKLVEKHKSILWTRCASGCINLMLEEIGKIDDVRSILDKAASIMKFFSSHYLILKLMKMHTQGRDLIQSSTKGMEMQFLTLQNMVSEKENLRNMFNSPAWKTSIWASTIDGKRVADLVWDPSFWAEVEEALKATVPLIRVLGLIDGDDKNPMAYIYDAMDQAKETIRNDFRDDEGKYMPVWKIIDAIWNNQLHNPLHSTGYFLNPAIFYSNNFYGDSEVSSGLMFCIECMVPDLNFQSMLLRQIDDYRAATGGFADKIVIEQRTKSLPGEWWSFYCGHAPQLQRFARRILSQTCSCKAGRFEMNRCLIEASHSKVANEMDKQRLHDLVFVHANLRLRFSYFQQCKNSSSFMEDIEARNDGKELDHGNAATNIEVKEDSPLAGSGDIKNL